jgi:hypothetical protein
MVDIETLGGLTTSADDLARFAGALDDARAETGAASSLDRATGAVSASFTVAAADAASAADVAARVFRRALASSGFGGAELARISVERIELTDPIPA